MSRSYAHGLPIMLVDHDTSSLMSLTSMLQQYSYKVTTVEQAHSALSTIDEQLNEFKLIIANPKMPDLDTKSFLTALLQKDIPLILISSDMTTTKASHFLTRGACFCLKKPISTNEAKYLWQHAVPKKLEDHSTPTPAESNHTNLLDGPMNNKSMNDKNQIETVNDSPEHQQAKVDPKGKDIKVPENITEGCSNSKDDQIEALRGTVRTQNAGTRTLSKGKRPMTRETKSYGDGKRRKLEIQDNNRISASKSVNDHEETKEGDGKEEDKEDDEESNDQSEVKRRGSVWNAKLHRKFIAALAALGNKNARPKSILQMMNVPNLTQRQVASHLQKYKAQVQRLSEITPITTDRKSMHKTLDYTSNQNYPFRISNVAKNLLTSDSSWHSFEWRNSSSSVDKSLYQSQEKFQSRATTETSNRKPEFCLGGQINLYKLPHFVDMVNNSNTIIEFSSVPQNTGFVPPTIVSNLPETYLPVPSAASYNACYVPEANVNQIGPVLAGASYNPLAYSVSSSGLYAPGTEFGQTGFVPSAESYIPPEYALQPSGYVPQTNVNQLGLVPYGGSYIRLDNTMPSATGYFPESIFNPMDLVPNHTTPCVVDDFLTPPSESNQSPVDLGEIMKPLDVDHIDGLNSKDGKGDVGDELLNRNNGDQNEK